MYDYIVSCTIRHVYMYETIHILSVIHLCHTSFAFVIHLVPYILQSCMNILEYHNFHKSVPTHHDSCQTCLSYRFCHTGLSYMFVVHVLIIAHTSFFEQHIIIFWKIGDYQASPHLNTVKYHEIFHFVVLQDRIVLENLLFSFFVRLCEFRKMEPGNQEFAVGICVLKLQSAVFRHFGSLSDQID